MAREWDRGVLWAAVTCQKHGQGLMREQGRASVRSSMVETKSIGKLMSKAFKRELYLPKGGDLLGPGVGFG